MSKLNSTAHTMFRLIQSSSGVKMRQVSTDGMLLQGNTSHVQQDMMKVEGNNRTKKLEKHNKKGSYINQKYAVRRDLRQNLRIYI